ICGLNEWRLRRSGIIALTRRATARSALSRPISPGKDKTTMQRWRKLAAAAILASGMALGGPGLAAAQTKPEGEMRFAVYGTVASGAGWIGPTTYVEKVGPDEFIKHPVGLGPYKFVSMKPGVELVMEANESYWRKVPSVKRIVFQSVPEATTRLAKLKQGEVDVAYLLEGELGESIKSDATLKLVFSGGIATN